MLDASQMKLLFFGLLILAVALEVIGDIFFKKWALSNQNTLIAAGLAVYFIGTAFWAFSLKYEYLSKAISVFTVLNLVAVVLVGVFLFKDDLTLINKIGIVLGVISVLLIELF